MCTGTGTPVHYEQTGREGVVRPWRSDFGVKCALAAAVEAAVQREQRRYTMGKQSGGAPGKQHQGVEEEVEPGRCCSPRHRHAFEPSSLELNGRL